MGNTLATPFQFMMEPIAPPRGWVWQEHLVTSAVTLTGTMKTLDKNWQTVCSCLKLKSLAWSSARPWGCRSCRLRVSCVAMPGAGAADARSWHKKILCPSGGWVLNNPYQSRHQHAGYLSVVVRVLESCQPFIQECATMCHPLSHACVASTVPWQAPTFTLPSWTLVTVLLCAATAFFTAASSACASLPCSQSS